MFMLCNDDDDGILYIIIEVDDMMIQCSISTSTSSATTTTTTKLGPTVIYALWNLSIINKKCSDSDSRLVASRTKHCNGNRNLGRHNTS